MKKVISIILISTFGILFLNAQFLQQGPPLLGTGFVGPGPEQGTSVALSSDGNTAIIGGPNDGDLNPGATWIFTRTNGVWSQQGSKLVGTGAIDLPQGAFQGRSVSISADGNTSIIGGNYDSNGVGALWVFTRTNGVWSQQGSKLIGTGASGNAYQGISVSLSADGNTAITGGIYDNTNIGAAWVFTRTAGVWSQQGNKLVGANAIGDSYQGISVSISGDGNTAVVGGYEDNFHTGAAWVYSRIGGVWEEMSKLVGTGAFGGARQGWSAAISGDGKTIAVGGAQDANQRGAIWIYTLTNGDWIQQGPRIFGTGASGFAWQGVSASLSYSGDTLIEGGDYDGTVGGAAWIFTRDSGVWTQLGSKLIGTGGGGYEGYSVGISSDGTTAIVGGPGDGPNGISWIYSIPSITGLETINKKQEVFYLYPNPALSTITINQSTSSPNQQLLITNILGEEIYHQAINNSIQLTIDISQWSNGVYFYQIRGDKETLQGRFVKQ